MIGARQLAPSRRLAAVAAIRGRDPLKLYLSSPGLEAREEKRHLPAGRLGAVGPVDQVFFGGQRQVSPNGPGLASAGLVAPMVRLTTCHVPTGPPTAKTSTGLLRDVLDQAVVERFAGVLP